MIELKPTNRGFLRGEFTDENGESCSIQKSSIATDDLIWLGVNNANPIVMASQAASVGVATRETTGWVPYPVPDGVHFTTRMHLTREQVAELLPILQHFVETGELPEPPKAG